MTKIHTLSNGLRVVVDPMPGLESAAIGVWVNAGARHETLEENGVAHLLEHMAFKGTASRTARQIVEEIEAAGGYLNAGTGYQRTGYYARVLKDDVPLALDLLADILRNPLFDADELEKEKDVVVQEIGEANDEPQDAVSELTQSLAWKDQALGRPILGTEDRVRSHDRARLLSFTAARYRPRNMVVVASGAVLEDEVLRQVEALFGDMTNDGAAENGAAPARYTSGRAADRRKTEQAHLMLAYPGVGLNDEGYFASRVFTELLGGGMSSRLFQSVREDHGLAYSVYSYSDVYDDGGIVGVYAGCDAGKAADAARLSVREIAAVAEGVSEGEVARARAQLKSALLMSRESPSARAEAAAGQLFAFGRLRPAAEIAAAINAVTPGAVAGQARATLEGACTVALVGSSKFDSVCAAVDGALSA